MSLRWIFATTMVWAIHTPTALAEAWVPLEGTFGSISYDRDSVVRDGDSFRVWLMNTSIANDNPIYSSFHSYVEVNCKDRTSLTLERQFVRTDGTRGKGVSQTPDTREPYVAASSADKVAKLLCKRWWEFWKH